LYREKPCTGSTRPSPAGVRRAHPVVTALGQLVHGGRRLAAANMHGGQRLAAAKLKPRLTPALGHLVHAAKNCWSHIPLKARLSGQPLRTRFSRENLVQRKTLYGLESLSVQGFHGRPPEFRLSGQPCLDGELVWKNLSLSLFPLFFQIELFSFCVWKKIV
jgi:hypothetical protein